MGERIVISMICFFIILSCGRTKQNTTSQTETTKQKEIKNFQSPSEVVLSFLKYYREKPEESFGDDFYRIPQSKDSSMYFRVDFTGTNKFLNRLFNTGYLSETFIENFRKFFKTQDSLFLYDLNQRREPESPQLLFDGDLIMHSNTWWKDNLNYLDSAKVSEKIFSDKKANVVLIFYYKDTLSYLLSNENSKWLIDKIK